MRSNVPQDSEARGLRLRTSGRATSYLALVVGVAVAVAGVVVTRESKWSWIRIAVALAVAVTPPLIAEVHRYMTRKEALTQLARQSSAGAVIQFPRVRDLTPIQVGAHTPVRAVDHVARDQEVELSARLRHEGRLLLMGSSMAGKTHLAHRLLQIQFGDRSFFRPADGTALHNLLSHGVTADYRLVIWLDELQNFTSTGGLTSDDLTAFTKNGAVVVATIRTREYTHLRPSDERKLPGSEALAWFGEPALLRDWSSTELERLPRAGNEDLVRGAREVGLSQYLGGSPLATRELATGKTDCPEGYALVRVAADWRRTGIGTFAPRKVLEAAVADYLPANSDLSPERITQGLEWATTRLNQSVALLERRNTDRYQVLDFIYELFDHDLDDLGADSDPDLQVRDTVWRCALSAATSEELNDIGARAFFTHGQPDVAVEAWQRSLHPSAQYHLTMLLGLPVSPDKIRLSAAHASKPEDHAHLAMTLNHIGDTDAAELSARAAAAGGDTSALFNLAAKRQNENDFNAAEQLYLEADAAGMPLVGFNLGLLYVAKNDLTQAEFWFRRSAERNLFPGAMYRLATLLELRGDTREADQWYQRGAESGWSDAMTEYAKALHRRGDREGSETWARRAAEDEHVDAMVLLSALLEEQPETADEAHSWLQRAAAAGYESSVEESTEEPDKRGVAEDGAGPSQGVGIVG